MLKLYQDAGRSGKAARVIIYSATIASLLAMVLIFVFQDWAIFFIRTIAVLAVAQIAGWFFLIYKKGVINVFGKTTRGAVWRRETPSKFWALALWMNFVAVVALFSVLRFVFVELQLPTNVSP